MPKLYHPKLPREQVIDVVEYGPDHAAAGWLPVDDESAPEQPVTPVNREQAPAPLDIEKENGS